LLEWFFESILEGDQIDQKIAKNGQSGATINLKDY